MRIETHELIEWPSDYMVTEEYPAIHLKLKWQIYDDSINIKGKESASSVVCGKN